MIKKIYPRMLGRMEFVVDLALRGSKVGAEIGVWQGEFSKGLLKIIPELKLYLVDPWRNMPDYSDATVDVSDKCFEYMYQMVKEKVKGCNAEFLRMTSMEALLCVPDDSLDFVYIDANHNYKSVMADIKGWSKKVKLGGIVSGHDYDFQHPECVQAVNESCSGNLDYYEPAKIWAYIK